ncbi:MAG: hypothetical protein QOE70_2529, partial [Chthoniobacter sp.]|nr:hypothetical protein [Chthoniobacter sp.]
QPRENSQPVKAGQVQIEDEQIRRMIKRRLQPRIPIVLRAGIVPAARQRTGDVPGEFGFIFNNKYAHLTRNRRPKSKSREDAFTRFGLRAAATRKRCAYWVGKVRLKNTVEPCWMTTCWLSTSKLSAGCPALGSDSNSSFPRVPWLTAATAMLPRTVPPTSRS